MNKWLPVPGVSGVLFDAEGQVLLTKRSQKVMEPGRWCIPGGHFDGGCSWESSIAKEVLEETGLVIQKPKLIGLYSDPVLTQYDIPNESRPKHFVVATFLIREFSGTLTLNDEVDAFQWALPSNLPDDLIEANRAQIQDAVQFKGTPFVR